MKAYEGDQKYIFISYSHKDSERVIPVVERLSRDGYHVWYDEEIEVGTEWPETIATHLMNCSLFMAFISPDYLDSFNCKREIDYAVSKRKNFIAVWLDKVELTPGMEMQLSSVQSISMRGGSQETFFRKLYQSASLNACKEESVEEVKPAAKEIKPFVVDDTALPVKKVENNKKIKIPKALKFAPVILGIIIIGIFAVKGLSKTEIAGNKISLSAEQVDVSSSQIDISDIRRLAKLKKLERLTFKDCDFREGSVDYLSVISGKIALVDFENCTGIQDYSWISGLSELSSLHIIGCDLTDEMLATVDFSGLHKLRFIELNDNYNLSNIEPLKNCEKLASLEINQTAVSDLSAIGELPELSHLGISHTKIESLKSLEKMQGLKSLVADGNGIKDLKGLEEKENMTKLNLADNELTGIDELEAMYKLDTLSVAGNKLTSVSGLSGCAALEHVDLSNNELEDVSALGTSLVTIKVLYLNGNKLKDLSCLAGMKSLEEVELDNNELEDLSFLTESNSLKMFSANNNRIESLEPLYGLKELSSIFAANNNISGVVHIEGYSELYWVALQHNKITKIIFNGAEHVTSYNFSTGVCLNLLSAYDNPLCALVNGTEQGAPIREGYLTYPDKGTCEKEGISFDPYSMAELFNSLYISDVPYDDRLQLEKHINEIEYTTVDYMDTLIAEKMNED